MKTIKILTLTIFVALVSCKKEATLNSDCTNETDSYDWILEKAELVTRKSSDNLITARRDTTSSFSSYTHRLKDGIYYQAAINSNNYTQAGTYTATKLNYNTGSVIVYTKTSESSKLVLERILYSIDTNLYVTERNTFINN